MNKQNVREIVGNSSEDYVASYLTKQGWKVFIPRHKKGMADLVVYHEDLGCITYQVKTLARQGGQHIASNDLVMEGVRPRIVVKLKDKKRYYKDNGIDWMVGVDPETHECFFYPLCVYEKCGSQLTIDTVKPVEHPEAPELECFKDENDIKTLEEILE